MTRELQFRELRDDLKPIEPGWISGPTNDDNLQAMLRAVLESGAVITSVMFRMADGGFLEWRLKPYPERVDEAIDQDWRVVRLAPATQNGSWVITEEITK